MHKISLSIIVVLFAVLAFDTKPLGAQQENVCWPSKCIESYQHCGPLQCDMRYGRSGWLCASDTNSGICYTLSNYGDGRCLTHFCGGLHCSVSYIYSYTCSCSVGLCYCNQG